VPANVGDERPTFLARNGGECRALLFLPHIINIRRTQVDNKFLSLLKSRKFWAGIVGLAVVVVGERAGVDATQLTEAVAVIVAYILGTALEDGLSRR